MATIRVHTAQNVTLEYEVASLGDRILATILDGLVMGAWAVACVLTMVTSRTGSGGFGTMGYLVLVLAYAPLLFYNLLCEVFFNGQSVGKKALNIKVFRLDGTTPRLGDYLMRWLLRIVDFQLAGLVALITIAASGRGQRLGDMAAGTTVVKLRPRAAPLASPAPLPGYQVVFPQAALLADHDVVLVRQLMQQARARQNYEVLNEVANKVKALTGIRTDLRDEPFLQTVLRDHAHLAATA